jgi:hypothetical protein
MHVSSCIENVIRQELCLKTTFAYPSKQAHELNCSLFMDCKFTCFFTTNGLIFMILTAHSTVFVRTEGDTLKKFWFCVLQVASCYV